MKPGGEGPGGLESLRNKQWHVGTGVCLMAVVKGVCRVCLSIISGSLGSLCSLNHQPLLGATVSSSRTGVSKLWPTGHTEMTTLSVLLCTKNGSYIFKWLQENSKKNNL